VEDKIIPDLLYRLRYPATIVMPSLKERMTVGHDIIISASLPNPTKLTGESHFT